MKEGLDVLRILFYANLLSGQHDTGDIIETERENDDKMEVELINRRQQRNDENEDENPNSMETSPTSPTARGATNRLRRSTNEFNENESPFENPLQIKLGLKPNEYRYGQYPFDDFVNEYANEKIEIRKEYLSYIQRTTNTIQFSFIFYPFFLSTINKIGKDKKNISFFRQFKIIQIFIYFFI